jgi:hypothetical protein
MLRSVFSRVLGIAVAFAAFATSTDAAEPARVELAGHLLPGLDASAPKSAAAESAPLTLTVVLRRSDEAGFERYLADVYDPASPEFRHFPHRSKSPTASARASPTTRP